MGFLAAFPNPNLNRNLNLNLPHAKWELEKD